MKIEQKKWTSQNGWQEVSSRGLADLAQLVLVFGGRAVLKDAARFNEIKAFYPKAHIVLCSTAGEIIAEEVLDNSISLTAVEFAKTKIEFAQAEVKDAAESQAIGQELAKGLSKDGLVHAMVYSDGLKVNGTALVQGLLEVLPKNVSVTGGLVGDGADFKETVVGLDEVPKSGRAVLMGFYGDSLKIGYGSLGGWDPFGPDRQITKSKNNVLYELDGQPALKLYKEYLGEKLTKELPGSGLLFPLSLRLKQGQGEVEVVRTLLAVNEQDQSMTFAGDMPEGVYAKLMKANFERLIEGAGGAAGMSIESIGASQAELAILISCIGRKLVLKERIEEEISAVIEKIGTQAAVCGFYSYGEICPTAATEKQCQLHNQTMTITTLREV